MRFRDAANSAIGFSGLRILLVPLFACFYFCNSEFVVCLGFFVVLFCGFFLQQLLNWPHNPSSGFSYSDKTVEKVICWGPIMAALFWSSVLQKITVFLHANQF